MKFFEHQFDSVEDYLHHRPPYLMVDSIDQIESDAIKTRTTVKPDSFYIRGHFPGAPILPGAMMQEMSTQSAGILIAARYNPMQSFDTHDPMHNQYALGVLVRVKNAKYRGFARPGDELTTHVKLEEVVGNVFEFTGQVRSGSKTIMRNRFQLSNILSSLLIGNEDQQQAAAATSRNTVSEQG